MSDRMDVWMSVLFHLCVCFSQFLLRFSVNEVVCWWLDDE